jgi:hypothetical protein
MTVISLPSYVLFGKGFKRHMFELTPNRLFACGSIRRKNSEHTELVLLKWTV